MNPIKSITIIENILYSYNDIEKIWEPCHEKILPNYVRPKEDLVIIPFNDVPHMIYVFDNGKSRIKEIQKDDYVICYADIKYIKATANSSDKPIKKLLKIVGKNYIKDYINSIYSALISIEYNINISLSDQSILLMYNTFPFAKRLYFDNKSGLLVSELNSAYFRCPKVTIAVCNDKKQYNFFKGIKEKCVMIYLLGPDISSNTMKVSEEITDISELVGMIYGIVIDIIINGTKIKL